MVTLYGYDDAGRLVKTIQSASQPSYNNSYGLGSDPTLANYLPNSTPDQDIISLNQYDAVGNLVQTTDALGNVTLTGYDALNRPVRTIRNARQPAYNWQADSTLSGYVVSGAADQDFVDYTEYDSAGRVRRSQDTLGNWTLSGYDGLDRLVKTIRNASQPNYNLSGDPSLSSYLPSSAPDQDLITRTAYDTVGRVMYSADVLGRQTWSAYDGLNRVVRTITNASGTATDGSAKDPRSPTYNPITNLSDTDLIATTTYDSNGYLLWTQDAMGRKTWTAYDSVGRPVRTITNATGTATDGSPTDPRSPNALVSAVPDQDVVTQTQYDGQGRVSMTVDALGHQTQYRYDALGRRVQTIVNFSSGRFRPAFPDQDLISTTTYDVAGRVLATTDPRGTQTTFTYDRAGRRLTITQAAGTALATMAYTCYDKGGRVLRTLQNWISTPGQPSPDARDAQGNWLFNPSSHGTNNDQNLIATYTLDRAGRPVAVSDPLGNTTRMTYYKDGQAESSTDALAVVTKCCIS